MSWIEHLGRIIRRWLPGETPPPTYETESVSERPDAIEPGLIYLVGTEDQNWCASFRCPCGCGNPVHLNLLAGRRPRWRIIRHGNGAVSIRPSVWRSAGCRSHFYISGGRVIWCRSREGVSGP